MGDRVIAVDGQFLLSMPEEKASAKEDVLHSEKDEDIHLPEEKSLNKGSRPVLRSTCKDEFFLETSESL